MKRFKQFSAPFELFSMVVWLVACRDSRLERLPEAPHLKKRSSLLSQVHEVTLTAALTALFGAFQWRAALNAFFRHENIGLLCCSEVLRGLQVTAKQGDWHERSSDQGLMKIRSVSQYSMRSYEKQTCTISIINIVFTL